MKYRLIFNDQDESKKPLIEFTSKRINHLLSYVEGINFVSSDVDCDIEINLDTSAPLIDERVIAEVAKLFFDQSVTVKFIGGVYGSVPISININGGSELKTFYVGKQEIAGVNLNLARKIREKIFFSLLIKFPQLQSAPFSEIVDILNSNEAIDLILKYGEDEISIREISQCPCCQSEHLLKLYHSEGNVKGGFLSNDVSFYSRCKICEYVFLTKQVDTNSLGIYYTNDVYDRSGDIKSHHSRWSNLNEDNSSHYANYLHAIEWIDNHNEDEITIVDLGCGKGDFAALAKNEFPQNTVLAIDWHLPHDLQKAFRESDINYISGPIHSESLDSYSLEKVNLVTMWEVIEHLKLDDLKDLLDYIYTILDDSGALVLSTPDFEDKHSQSLDFWAMAPGEHLSIFSKSVISRILKDHGFKVKKIGHESVTIKLPRAWYDYGEKTSSYSAGCASASIIEDLISNDNVRDWYKSYCRENNIGSEMIIIAEKE